MSVYKDILDKYKMIDDLIDEGAPAEVFTEAFNTIDGDLAEHLENLTMIIINRQGNIAAKETEIERLSKSVKSEKNSIKHLKEHMQYLMVTANRKKLKGEKFSFNVQKNPPSLLVHDDTFIPEDFIKVEEIKTIDKKAILAELKNGAEIQGVEIQQGESIRIR